ncbi:MAG TPA: hypothetical protein VN918_09345, partial [Myxococcaceae bacterium]|nr:hypothetical protein [Myxococcaceae bacterium]
MSQEQLAHVRPQDMSGVNLARAALARASDRVAREDLALKSAQKEVDVANQQTRVAQAEIDRSTEVLKKAELDRSGTASAQRQLNLYRAQLTAAQAQAISAKSQSDLAAGKKAEAEAERDLAKSQLDWEEYEALARTGDPSAKNVDANGIQARIAEQKKRVDEERSNVAQYKAAADRDRAAWTSTKESYNALRGVGGAGER